MHPRNRYKYKKPDFEALASKYPDFKKFVTSNEKGKPWIDFKDTDALRLLTTLLLQEDYGLKVELPPDRLVPTLPLRLNYVHWIEDIVSDWDKKQLSGIDIGMSLTLLLPKSQLCSS
jgi:methyltransferase